MSTPSSFVRIDPALGTNAKIQEASDDLWLAVVGLYVLIIGWCDTNCTDGRITRRYVTGKRGIAPGSDEVLDEMIRVGLIEQDGDYLYVHDYLEWQRSAAEKRAASEKARAAARARFDAHAKRNATRNATSNATSNAVSNATSNAEREEREERKERACVIRARAREQTANIGENIANIGENIANIEQNIVASDENIGEERQNIEADIEQIAQKCADVYPLRRYIRQGRQAVMEAIEQGLDGEQLLAACTNAPRDIKQTLRFFVEDGTWRDYVPKRPRGPCGNPECVSGYVIQDGVASPCPECNGGRDGD